MNLINKKEHMSALGQHDNSEQKQQLTCGRNNKANMVECSEDGDAFGQSIPRG